MSDTMQIIFHPNHLGMSADEDTLTTALRVIAVGFGTNDTWWSPEKYGADFENDVFLMHSDCGGCSDGCPWCIGCGHYQESGACQACKIESKHSADCYQSILRGREKALAEKMPEPDSGAHDSPKFKAWVRWHDRHDKARNKIYDELCSRFSVDRNFGAAVHCTCGDDDARAERRKVIGCDYTRGTGIFARFAPWTNDCERRYYDPPHFWFKPDNFRVNWYKYIGRDMSSNADSVRGDFLAEIFATHPTGMTVKDAVAELQRRTEETSQMWSNMLRSIGVEVRPFPPEPPSVQPDTNQQ